MPASPNDPRTKRRKAMGDDPNKMSIAPQPVPGAPQGAGNQMNYPMEMNQMGEIGQKIGDGPYQFPYGDLGRGIGSAAEPIGFAQPSGQPESIVPGRGLNGPYNAMMQPDAKQMEQMAPIYEMSSAQGFTMPNGLNNGQPVSYGVTALGPSGGRDPAMLPPQMEYTGPSNLPMSGGMNTGRGGGRSKGKN